MSDYSMQQAAERADVSIDALNRNDSCYTEFTPGQVARAQDAWLLYRAS